MPPHLLIWRGSGQDLCGTNDLDVMPGVTSPQDNLEYRGIAVLRINGLHPESCSKHPGKKTHVFLTESPSTEFCVRSCGHPVLPIILVDVKCHGNHMSQIFSRSLPWQLYYSTGPCIHVCAWPVVWKVYYITSDLQDRAKMLHVHGSGIPNPGLCLSADKMFWCGGKTRQHPWTHVVATP